MVIYGGVLIELRAGAMATLDDRESPDAARAPRSELRLNHQLGADYGARGDRTKCMESDGGLTSEDDAMIESNVWAHRGLN